jgi:hypothetical protein
MGGGMEPPRTLADVYDPPTLARVERGPSPGRRPVPGARRGGAAVALAALLRGVGDVLQPERVKEVVEEIDLDSLVDSHQPIVYIHVPGAPAASRVIVRPWLLRSA